MTGMHGCDIGCDGRIVQYAGTSGRALFPGLHGEEGGIFGAGANLFRAGQCDDDTVQSAEWLCDHSCAPCLVLWSGCCAARHVDWVEGVPQDFGQCAQEDYLCLYGCERGGGDGVKIMKNEIMK